MKKALTIFLLLLGFRSVAASLDIPITVKEVAGVGNDSFPMKVVVPFAKGSYQDTNTFRLVDSAGNTVSAQFDVLNRWWAADSSIRHLTVSFQPKVGALGGSGNGISVYHLKDDGKGNNIASPLSVYESGNLIEVNTGPLRFTINKSQFAIISELWFGSRKIVSQNSGNGGRFVGRLPGDTQLDSARTNIQFTIEKAGPIEAVIKAQSQTRFNSTTDHQHGFAVRIYAYAGKSYLKIDYQLQNSAIVAHSWPLYFKGLEINWALDLNQPTVKIDPGNGTVYSGSQLTINQDKPVLTGSRIIRQDNSILATFNPAQTALYNSTIAPYVDVSDSSAGVMAVIRNFWQTFPNEISASQSGLTISLWPQRQGQCNWEDEDGMYLMEKLTGTPCVTEETRPAGNLYWLDDMQHVYKEVLLYFHDSGADLAHLAKTFQDHPVASIPAAQYQLASASVDMGGLIPSQTSIQSTDIRKYSYIAKDFTRTISSYRFGWDSFYVDEKLRKFSPSSAGGWPSPNPDTNAAKFMLTGDPRDYWVADLYSIGELNAKNQSLANYSYDRDYAICKLRDKYAGASWRPGELAASYIPPSWKMKLPRDDEHGWFYFMEEAYYITANPWIKDWYEFIGEFRKTMLRNPTLSDRSSRAVGNMLSNALQAYRVTGDMSILEDVPAYLKYIRSLQNKQYGFKASANSREASFQAGFMLRAFISYMSEIKDKNPQAWAEAFQFVSGYVEWNYLYGSFGYYVDARTEPPEPSGCSGLTFVDPQAWYYLHTGKRQYWDQINAYFTTGLNGGGGPCGSFTSWKGQFEGRYMIHAKNTQRMDTIPPEAIKDLKATRNGSTVRLSWSASADQAYYHIVFSDKPIVYKNSVDTNYANWWAANTVSNKCVAAVNGTASCSFSTSLAGKIYAAVFSFDRNENMSLMSNLAVSEGASSVSPPANLKIR